MTGSESCDCSTKSSMGSRSISKKWAPRCCWKKISSKGISGLMAEEFQRFLSTTVSGRLVLLFRLFHCHNLRHWALQPVSSETCSLKSCHRISLSTFVIGCASNLYKSWCGSCLSYRLKSASVTILKWKYRCCSSFSLRLFCSSFCSLIKASRTWAGMSCSPRGKQYLLHSDFLMYTNMYALRIDSPRSFSHHLFGSRPPKLSLIACCSLTMDTRSSSYFNQTVLPSLLMLLRNA
mmetsp:Transcript_60867/g.100700  ORF Transcript_60867/g.100700 Transcript_60867/m.100700 type:complete len:235 (+) Transcript_60867:3075-3779(+)